VVILREPAGRCQNKGSGRPRLFGVARGASWMVFLNTTPKFDRLRAAPGYSALLKGIGFD